MAQLVGRYDAEVGAPFMICEAVIPEAAFLLRRTSGRGFEGLPHSMESDSLDFSFALAFERRAISELLRKYTNVSMSLADACLVGMEEIHPDAQVLTTDGDFRIYRKSNRRVVPLVAPPA